MPAIFTPAFLALFLVFRRTRGSASKLLLAFLFGAVLAGCNSEPAFQSLDESLRVRSVEVIVPVKSKYGETYLPAGQARYFPSASIGLTREKVARDLTETASRVMIPASRSGSRLVDVKIEVYVLVIRGTVLTPDNATKLVAVMDVLDASTGEFVVEEKWFRTTEGADLTPMEWYRSMGSDGNYIRSYDLIRTLFANELSRQIVGNP